MYRIALVSPPYGGSSDSMRPIGLMAIHSYLSNEFAGQVEIKLFDYSDLREDDYAQLDADDICDYDMVGLCAYSTNFPIVLEWGKEIKGRRHDVTTVIGGPHPTAMPAYVAAHHGKVFDFVVRGEGERPLSALVQSLLDGARPPRTAGLVYRDALGIVEVGTTDPVKDLNTIPTPIAPVNSPYEFELVCYDHKQGRFRKAYAFTTSRGCPFSCTFCSIRAADSKWRAVGPERLGEWIGDALKEDSTIEHINFMDADFLIQKKRVVAIGDMFERRYPGLTWSFSGRVDDLKRLGESALRKLVSQGLIAVEVGFETGSQAMLDRMGKRVTVQDNYDAIAMLKGLDLDILIDFILFVPDETPAQLRESLEFIRRANLTDYLPHDHYFTTLIQYPATPLRKFYEELFDVKFSMDVLPEPDDLFDNAGTKKIFAYYFREFQSAFRFRLAALIAKVDSAAQRFASAGDRQRAQYLRIEGMSLRHLPFLVLEALIDSYDDGRLLETSSLHEAVPWLANLKTHVENLEDLCDQAESVAA